MTDLVKNIKIINNEKLPEPIPMDKSPRLKTFIIQMFNDSYSTYLSRQTAFSIEGTRSNLDYSFFPATTPTTIKTDLFKVFYFKYPNKITWTWPTSKEKNGYCLKTGLYQEYNEALDILKTMAASVSHVRLWQMCMDLNQPILILEHDTQFIDEFDTSKISFDGGLLCINNPFDISLKYRNEDIFKYRTMKDEHKINPIPSTDCIGDLNRPQTVPGTSAYIIKPWFAKMLLDKVEEIGLWPTEQFLNTQMFSCMEMLVPPYVVKTKGSLCTKGHDT